MSRKSTAKNRAKTRKSHASRPVVTCSALFCRNMDRVDQKRVLPSPQTTSKSTILTPTGSEFACVPCLAVSKNQTCAAHREDIQAEGGQRRNTESWTSQNSFGSIGGHESLGVPVLKRYIKPTAKKKSNCST